MSNPTELPDLDNLEAKARAADQDGQHIYTNPRDSNNWRANEIWHYLASPAAVLALIALARRAKPEGEAPQAATEGYLVDPGAGSAMDRVCRQKPNENEMAEIARRGGSVKDLIVRPAATLSPLCGAQNAESGKEADAAEKAAAYDELNRIAEFHGFASAAAAIAAAPGLVKPELMRQAVASVVSRAGDELRIGWLRPERCDVGTLLYCAVEKSAPGTPEAPAAAEKLYSSWLHSQPDRYNIPPWRLLAESVKIEWEQRAAAQLDGGQEGSE